MGGKSKKMPDYSRLESLGYQGQQMANGLGQQQLNFAQQQFDQNNPLFRDMVSTNMGLQTYNANMGRSMGDMYQNTYMPMMQEQANAARNFNTDAYREGLAQQAAADVARAFSTQQGASDRNMAAMGVNPNSGRFAGQQRAGDISLAAARAGAMTGTRRQAEAEGFNRVGSAINSGQGLAGMAGNAFTSSMNAGNAAGNMLQVPGNTYMQGLQGAGNTMLQGHQYAMQGLQGSLGGQMDAYNTASAENGAMWGGIGSLAGGVAGSFLGPMGTAAGSYFGKYLAGRMAS